MLKMFIPFVYFLFSYTLRSSKHDLSSSSVIVDEINCPNKSCVLIIPQGKTVTETETENRNINNLINLCFFPSYAFLHIKLTCSMGIVFCLLAVSK